MGKFSTGSSALAWGNHQSQAKSYSIHIYLLDNWVSLGKLGQVWRRQQFRKMGKKAERIKKEHKNLSGDGEGGGEEGESRV